MSSRERVRVTDLKRESIAFCWGLIGIGDTKSGLMSSIILKQFFDYLDEQVESGRRMGHDFPGDLERGVVLGFPHAYQAAKEDAAKVAEASEHPASDERPVRPDDVEEVQLELPFCAERDADPDRFVRPELPTQRDASGEVTQEPEPHPPDPHLP